MVTGTMHELKTLVGSHHPLIVIDSVEEDRADGIIRQLSTEMRLPLYEWTITKGLRDVRANADVMGGEVREILQEIAAGKFVGIFLFKDFAKLLDDNVVLRSFREVLQTFIKSRSAVVLVGSEISLPAEIKHKAVYFDLKLPAKEDLVRLVEEIVGPKFRTGSIQVDMKNEDWRAFIDALVGLTLNQARQTIVYCLVEDGKLCPQDVMKVLARKAKVIKEGGLLEYFPPDGNTHQIGGFAGLKKWMQRVKAGFGDKAKEFNLSPPKGVLITGVQGCGKSLAAKYIARELGLPYLKLEAASLYDKYIGETEKNLKRALQMAESLAPVVLWIDEMEKGFGSSNGSSGVEGAVSNRLLGYFLTWLQEKKQSVFVVGTTNDIFKLPAELQRKGRFDEIFFVDIPKSKERQEIFRIHLSIRNLNVANFDVNELAAASDRYNGAEIEQCIVGALYAAIAENAHLDQPRLLQELKAIVPLSVSRAEEIESIRALAKERFVGVD